MVKDKSWQLIWHSLPTAVYAVYISSSYTALSVVPSSCPLLNILTLVALCKAVQSLAVGEHCLWKVDASWLIFLSLTFDADNSESQPARQVTAARQRWREAHHFFSWWGRNTLVERPFNLVCALSRTQPPSFAPKSWCRFWESSQDLH